MTTNLLLSQAHSQAKTKVQIFVQQPDFLAQLQVAFGDDFDQNIALGIASQFQSGDFSLIPDIQVLTNGELDSANGAYAADLDRIFVSSDFLLRGDVSAITNLLLEEIGHKLDRVLNGSIDSPGDEGAIFAAIAQGQTLSTDALAQLRAEDDHRTISVDGKLVAIEMETWTGTSGDDTHTGVDPLTNALDGGAGNDTLYGNEGIDFLTGGAGNDILNGRYGRDFLYGGADNDTLYGGYGNDDLSGGTGNDTYVFNAANILGDNIVNESDGDGIDTLDFSSTTTIQGTTTIQNISINLSSTIPQTVAPGFQLTINGAIENAIGGAGNDNIYGNSLDNTLYGGSGNNTINGVSGNDVIHGGGDSDTLYGGSGNDTLIGNAGGDILFGESGNDILDGGYGNDELYGGADNDQLSGDAGNDTLYGGPGDDTYVFNAVVDTGSDIVDEDFFGNGIDTLDFSSTLSQAIRINLSRTDLQTVSPNLQITIKGSIENAIGGDGDDDLSGVIGTYKLYGRNGNDTLSGGYGNDYLSGEAGDDTLGGGSGNNTLDGGTGNDTYRLNAVGDTGISIVDETTGDGIDTLDFSPTASQAISVNLSRTDIQTVSSNLQITIKGSIENVKGGLLNDSIDGNSLDNTLSGGDGDDTIKGGAGNDTIKGGVGNDTLYGGTGDDIYIFNAATDTGSDIVDEAFSGSGLDTIDFSTTTTQAIGIDLSIANIQTSANIQTVAPGFQISLYGDIENVKGGLLNDIIYGNSLDNNLDGGSGDDFLNGRTGNDRLYGGDGNDTLIGGSGDDTLNGGTGLDGLFGGDGNDTYIVSQILSSGTTIDDSSGANDTLALTGGSTLLPSQISRNGTTLKIDLNNPNSSGIFQYLYIKNYFANATDYIAGSGFIENIRSGNTILINQFKAVRNDFNGDGKSDILWRNDNGALSLWQMNGVDVTANNLVASLPLSWKIAGTGDFNGDKKSDIVWRNQNNAVSLWQMNGSAVELSPIISSDLPSSWSSSETGDFDGDGKSDILWRNDNGAVAIWTMNGAAVTNNKLISGDLPSSWKNAGTGDFNGDGKSDLLWRNDNGAVAIWQTNGTTVTSNNIIASLTSDWKAAGTGDFNGDGKADILWRNDNGAVSLWQMDGNNVVAAPVISSVPTLSNDWQISGICDYTGDGKAEILWRNGLTGEDKMWFLNGSTATVGTVATLTTDWKSAAPVI
jgi:Ca2+-binding RTX toxin-like protein